MVKLKNVVSANENGFFCRNQVKWNNRRPCFCGISGGDQVIWAEAQSVLILFILLYTKWIFNPIQTGGGGGV